MVTNLPEEAKALWAKAAAVRDPRRKVKLLRQVYSKIPKHKGTAYLLMNLKKQISSLEEEIREKEVKAKKKGSGGLEWVVRKSGLIQLSVVGNTTDSAVIFGELSGLEPDIYKLYGAPVVGTRELGGVPFQLIWAPFDESIGRWLKTRIVNVVQNSDLAIVAGTCNKGFIEDAKKRFEEYNIILANRDISIDLEITPSGGIIISGSSSKLDHSQVRGFLRRLKIYNAIVKLSSESSIDDLEKVLLGKIFKKYLAVCYKKIDNLTFLYIYYEKGIFRILNDVNTLGEEILGLLKLIRVYTKPPGGHIAKPPLLLHEGATVKDAVRALHSRLLRTFKYARIWRGDNTRRVGLDFTLEDGDVIEVRA